MLVVTGIGVDEGVVGVGAHIKGRRNVGGFTAGAHTHRVSSF
jgi:hypothetical protein